jgi:hypothetical protein
MRKAPLTAVDWYPSCGGDAFPATESLVMETSQRDAYQIASPPPPSTQEGCKNPRHDAWILVGLGAAVVAATAEVVTAAVDVISFLTR